MRSSTAAEHAAPPRRSASGSSERCRRAALAVVASAVMATGGVAQATADGPDHYRVRGVSPGRHLTLRAEPSTAVGAARAHPLERDLSAQPRLPGRAQLRGVHHAERGSQASPCGGEPALVQGRLPGDRRMGGGCVPGRGWVFALCIARTGPLTRSRVPVPARHRPIVSMAVCPSLEVLLARMAAHVRSRGLRAHAIGATALRPIVSTGPPGSDA